MRPSRASRLVAKVRRKVRRKARRKVRRKVRRQLARARACVFSVFIVYCVCQIAARASPRQEKKGISSVNRRQSLSQTHSAKLKQLKH